MATVAQPEHTVAARVNRLPMTPVHYKLAILLCGLFLFELADLNTFGDAAPALIKYMGLNVGDIANATAAMFLGAFLGAWLGGLLSDIKGRKYALMLALVVYSICSFLNAIAFNVISFEVVRFFTGVGMQALSVIGMTYIGELYPKNVRGRYQALVLALGLLGIPVMAFWSRLMIPLGPNGWRYVFVLGGMGLVLAYAIRAWLPESPRWLESKGRVNEANQVMDDIEARIVRYLGHPLAAPEQEVAVVQATRVPVFEIFSSSYRRRTIVLTILWVFSLLGFYGFQAWIPTLLFAHGFTIVKSLTFTSIMALGAAPGALLAWPFIDRFQRRWLILITYILTAIFALLYGISTSDVGILLFGLAVSLSSQMAVAFLFTYSPEIFPTRVRSTGSGFANGVGRIGSAVGAIIVGVIFSSLGFVWVFVYIAFVWIVSGLVVGIFGEYTSQRALEDISH
ncbi:MAG: MFS transporter [Firmicutes bacterium]|nr:MFS transporter [Bacillota bacterium]